MKSRFRRLKDTDSARIHCTGPHHGEERDEHPAIWCEHLEWDTGNTKGISFFYMCDDAKQTIEATRAYCGNKTSGRLGREMAKLPANARFYIAERGHG